MTTSRPSTGPASKGPRRTRATRPRAPPCSPPRPCAPSSAATSTDPRGVGQVTTGRRSWTRANGGAADAVGWAIVKTFDELWAELNEKARERPEGSGTVAQLDAGVHAIGKKLVEEAAESWMAAEHEGKERTAEEISQLLYHAQVLMLASGISLHDVYTHL